MYSLGCTVTAIDALANGFQVRIFKRGPEILEGLGLWFHPLAPKDLET